MNELEQPKLSTVKAIVGSVLAFVILIVAQLISSVITGFLSGLGVITAINNVIGGVIYIALVILGAVILCKKYLKLSLEDIRLKPFRLNLIWIIIAFVMPLLVLLLCMVAGGYWEVNHFDSETTFALITQSLFINGFAQGIVE